MSREEIQVLYTIMDRTGNYSKLTATSICSLLENTKEKKYMYCTHWLTEQGITVSWQAHLSALCGRILVRR